VKERIHDVPKILLVRDALDGFGRKLDERTEMFSQPREQFRPPMFKQFQEFDP